MDNLELHITAALGAALKRASIPAPSPLLFGAATSPLSGHIDLTVRRAADRALLADLRRGRGEETVTP